jgi:hypothetical protein
MLMEVLHCREDLSHETGCLELGEFVHLNNLFKELTTFCELHHYVNITVVNIGFVKLDNVGVINLRKNGKLFLEELHIFLDVLFKYALHSILDLRVSDTMRDSDGPEMPSADKLLKRVDRADICRRKCLRNVFENLCA